MQPVNAMNDAAASPASTETLIRTISDHLAGVHAPTRLPPGLWETCLHESWFADTLAWLLTPDGSHGFGTTFANAFITAVARVRSTRMIKVVGKDEEKVVDKYARRATHFKFGKQGAGRPVSAFSLNNAACLREFHLSREIDGGLARKGRYCDIVLFDLDAGDSFFLCIEAKLFTRNHSGQLTDYVRAIESKFARVKCREYVYLTLMGYEPDAGTDDPTHLNRWVPMSWIDDVGPLLKKASESKPKREDNVRNALNVFEAVDRLIRTPPDVLAALRKLMGVLLEITLPIVLDEITRLGAGARGTWRMDEKRREHRFTLRHSSNSTRALTVQIKQNLQVVVTGRRPGKRQFEKILIPFGAQPDQVIHLIHLAARDVYHQLFDRTDLYLGAARKRSARTENEEKARPLLRFVWEHRLELMVLLSAKGLAKPAELVEGE